MKIHHFYVLSILFVSILSLSCSAFPIKTYHTRMEIQPDSSVLITERIVADFTGEPHHGIYRDIPFSGKDRYGNNYRIRHKIISVTDENGLPIQTKITLKSGRLRLRMGDPDQFVQDVRTYVIRYKVLRAVHYFETYDELYWNPVGPEWEVPIEKASCTVVLPKDVPEGKLQTTSYTGLYGSTTTDAESNISDPRTANFWMDRPLNPGEAMTIVVGWPKGIVGRPSFKDEMAWFIMDNGYFFLPPIFLVLLVGLWYRAGRDPDTGKSEMVAYDPPDKLIPAEIGALIDERVDMRDISATIIDLAVRGYIHITADVQKGFLSTKTDYLLELQMPYEQASKDENLTPFERELIRAVFSSGEQRWISSLKNHFYTHLPSLRNKLYKRLVALKYFNNRPDSVRLNYQVLGWIVLILGGVATVFLLAIPFVSFGWGLAIALCGICLIAAARTMPKKTKRGKDALIGARGFEEYLSRAERDEILHQERQGYFEKFLPYAMAFGIADRWASAFDGIQTVPPSWYTGDGPFHPSLFAQDMTSASESWANTFASQPRSEGGGGSSFFGGGSGFSGGFSGGGGGGGGGGGW